MLLVPVSCVSGARQKKENFTRYQLNKVMVGGTLSPATTVLPMTWQATLKPYNLVICAENFFFCCENSGVREGKTRREGPDPTYLPRHDVRPKQK